jgi:hypothetical protein
MEEIATEQLLLASSTALLPTALSLGAQAGHHHWLVAPCSCCLLRDIITACLLFNSGRQAGVKYWSRGPVL